MKIRQISNLNLKKGFSLLRKILTTFYVSIFYVWHQQKIHRKLAQVIKASSINGDFNFLSLQYIYKLKYIRII